MADTTDLWLFCTMCKKGLAYLKDFCWCDLIV